MLELVEVPNEPVLTEITNQPHNSKKTKSKQLTPLNQTYEFIEVVEQQVKFGNSFSGQIKEKDVNIINKTDTTISVIVICLSLNEEFHDLDEYVYSIRNPPKFQYNDKIILQILPNDATNFKIAVKVPARKTPCSIKGVVLITVKGIESKHNFIQIPVECDLVTPLLVSNRLLFDQIESI